MYRLLGLFLALGVCVLVACTSSSSAPCQESVRPELSLSPLDREVLEACFRTALRESELAAVLYGSKPICMDGPCAFQETPNFIRGSRCNVNGELYLQGLEIWQRLGFEGKKWSFIPTGARFIDDPSSVACLWINHDALHDVLKEHVEVFRGVLGSDISESELFARLTRPGVDLFEVLKHDETLMGLVLGYGLENSLVHKRLTDIRSLLLSQELVPLRPRAERLRGGMETRATVTPYKSMWIEVPPTELEARLRSDFEEICEEYSRLDANMIVSTQHSLAKGHHVPLFGCVSTSEDTRVRISEYVQAMQRAEEMLTRDDFVEQMVSQLCS
jgi:hypothetical protein